MRNDGRDGWIYLIGEDGSRTVKIGWSRKVGQRLQQIQAYSPAPMRVHWAHPGHQWQEIELHYQFHQHRSHGEWFTFPDGEDIPALVARELSFLPEDQAYLLVDPSDPSAASFKRVTTVIDRERQRRGNPHWFPTGMEIRRLFP